MIKAKKTLTIIGIILCLLLVFGCAPTRQKPNADEKNTGGSEELNAAIDALERIGLDLFLDDISALGESAAGGASEILPEPTDVAGKAAEINAAIDDLEDALELIDDPGSFEASYVHLYLGYAYILSATSELLSVDPDIITKTDDSYEFDTTSTGPANKTEAQAVVNAVYALTGNSYSGNGVTGPDAETLAHTSNAVDELQQSLDLIEQILPDSDPEELQALKNELTGGVTDDLEDTLVNDWGFLLN